MNIKINVLIIVLIIYTVLLQGCVSNDTIKAVGNAGSKGIISGGITATAINLSSTRKIKAQTAKNLNKAVIESKDTELILAQLRTNEVIAKNNRYIGMLEGASIWLFLIVIARVVRYVVGIYKPSEVTKKYNKG